jgi:replicative DNA helicase
MQETKPGSGKRRDRDQATSAEVLRELLDALPPHSPEAEMSLLGSLILDPKAVAEVLGVLQGPELFYSESHAQIFKAILALYDQHEGWDAVQLLESLRDRGQLEEVGGVDYLRQLAECVPSAVNAPHYARLVASKHRLRSLIDTAWRIIYDAHNVGNLGPDGVATLLDRAEAEIFEISHDKTIRDVTALADILQDEIERLEALEGKGLTGVPTGYTDLDRMLSGLQQGEMLILAARPSMGKAQPLDAGVLTPGGFVRMGDLRPGDELASVDGAPSRVVGVYPQGERQVYRVTLADGRSAECCDEHLWRVCYRGWDGPRVVSTAELREKLRHARYRNRVWIEPFAGEFGVERELPLDPWLLGLLLGDGNIKGGAVRVSAANPEIVARLGRAVASMGLRLRAIGGCDFRVIHTDGAHRKGVVGVVANPLEEALKELGLWDRGADQKFIPEAMFAATLGARRALLGGLLDSDGWVETFGAIRYATASRRLADDVVRLMRSMGGSGSWTRKRTWYTYKGVRREGLPAYVCNLQHPDPASLALTPVKGERLRGGRTRQRRLNIVSIEPTRVCQTQCIAVSHPSRLYVTDGYTVTHNTAMALNIAEQVAFGGATPWSGPLGKPAATGIFSLEMSRGSLAQRLISARSGIDLHHLRTGQMGMEEWNRLNTACGELHEAPLYIDDTPALTVLQLRARARRMVSQFGVKVIIIDYLQLLTSPTAARESRQVEVATISRGIKALARELNVPVVCLAQLNRGTEQREGNRPRMADLRESGSIEQDADVVMLLHREEYFHKGDEEWLADPDNEEKIGLAELIIAKQRNGPTGTVKFTWDSKTTRFKTHDPHHQGGYAEGYSGGSAGGGGGGRGGGFNDYRSPSQAAGAPPEAQTRPAGDYPGFAPGQKAGPVSGFRDGGGPAGWEDDEDDVPF